MKKSAKNRLTLIENLLKINDFYEVMTNSNKFSTFKINNKTVNCLEFCEAIYNDAVKVYDNDKHEVFQTVYFVEKFGYSTKLNQKSQNWYCAE